MLDLQPAWRVRAWDRLSQGDRVLGEREQDLSGASWCHRAFERLAVVVQPVGRVDRDGDHAGGDKVAKRTVGLLDLGAWRVAQPVEQPESGERYLFENEIAGRDGRRYVGHERVGDDHAPEPERTGEVGDDGASRAIEHYAEFRAVQCAGDLSRQVVTGDNHAVSASVTNHLGGGLT